MENKIVRVTVLIEMVESADNKEAYDFINYAINNAMHINYTKHADNVLAYSVDKHVPRVKGAKIGDKTENEQT